MCASELWSVVIDYAKSKGKKEERRKGGRGGVDAGEAPSTTPQSCSLAVWAEGRVNGKFSTTWIRRCEALRPTIREERVQKLLVAATIFKYLECQPHILPLIPALASHREESPQRHRKKPENSRIPSNSKTTRIILASEPARFKWAAHSQTPSTLAVQSSRRKCDQRMSNGRERLPRGEAGADRSENESRASTPKAQ